MPENILDFVDLSSGLKSQSITKGEVYHPENLKKMNFDKIIISVFGREENIITFDI